MMAWHIAKIDKNKLTWNEKFVSDKDWKKDKNRKVILIKKTILIIKLNIRFYYIFVNILNILYYFKLFYLAFKLKMVLFDKNRFQSSNSWFYFQNLKWIENLAKTRKIELNSQLNTRFSVFKIRINLLKNNIF